MYKKIFVIAVLNLFIISCYSQSVEWELYSPYGSYQYYDIDYTIKTDDEGNLYSVSYFKNSITIEGQILFVDGFNRDMLIVKYNENREVVWFKEIDLNFSNYYLGFDLDSNGDLIVASYMEDTLFLDNYIIEPNFERSAFIAKINKSGNTEWVKKIFDGYPTIHNLSVSSNDDILISGESWNGGFLARLDKTGNTIWKLDIDSPSGGNNVWGSDIKMAHDGTSYGVLMFQSQQINVSSDITLVNPYSWGIQMVLFKFDAEGNIVWYSQNTQGKFLKDVKFELDNASNVYLIGNFNNASLQLGDLELPIPPNNRSYGFIAKCSSEGEWEWLAQRTPWPNLSHNIAFDCQNEVIYSTGSKSIEIYSVQGSLENQLLFNEDITRCFSVAIGNNNNILLSGVTRDSIIGNGGFDWYNPFIVSVDYNSLISNEGCTIASALDESTYTGDGNLKVYPTIIYDDITIEILDMPLGDINLLLSTMDGKRLYETKISTNDSNKILINTDNIPSGIFVLTIVSKYEILSKKIIKLN